MRRLRVLELIKCLDLGGSEVLLLERLRVADHDRFEYAVGWLDRTRSQLAPDIASLGLDIRCFEARSVLDWRWLYALRQRLRRDPVDVVHVHSPLMASGVRAVVRSLGAGRPALVSTEHGVGHRLLTNLLGVLSVRADDVVFAVSDEVRSTPICRAARQVRTLHYGVNVRRIDTYRQRRDEWVREFEMTDAPRVVSVANFRPLKGHATLLAAARLIHARHGTARFYVAGQGPTEQWVRAEVATHDMASYYHVLGRVADAARLSACADVFALCSSSEGRPVALMEAMAAGAAVVATAVGAVPDIVQHGHNGLLVPPDDPPAVAKAIALLLDDPVLRERLARNAVASAPAFDMIGTARAIEEQYLRLCSARGGQPALADKRP